MAVTAHATCLVVRTECPVHQFSVVLVTTHAVRAIRTLDHSLNLFSTRDALGRGDMTRLAIATMLGDKCVFLNLQVAHHTPCFAASMFRQKILVTRSGTRLGTRLCTSLCTRLGFFHVVGRFRRRLPGEKHHEDGQKTKTPFWKHSHFLNSPEHSQTSRLHDALILPPLASQKIHPASNLSNISIHSHATNPTCR